MAAGLVRRAASPPLAGIVAGLTGYREASPALIQERQAAPLMLPLIVSFGTPFEIALGREIGDGDAQPSFAAGLFAGPVNIRSDGFAACVQADLTPLGAFRLFGGAVRDLAARMIPLEAMFGAAGTALRDRVAEAPSWELRFAVVEAFILARLLHAPSPEIVFAWLRLRRSGGRARVAALAGEIGWSRQKLHDRLRAELGLGPKPIARMLRFRRACALARTGGLDWAGVAAEAGYADQAHLVRDFQALAGEPPTGWARRVAAAEPRLLDDFAG